MSSKRFYKKIIMIFIAFSAGFMASLFIVSTFDSDRADKSEVHILYDSDSPTIIKSEELFSDLITESSFSIKKSSIESESDLHHYLDQFSSVIEILVIIGHGEPSGVRFGEELIFWQTLATEIEDFNFEFKIFLSCFSEMVLGNLSAIENTICFENKIDYVAASYVAAISLAEYMKSDALLGRVYRKAEADIDNIIGHAFYCLEPLWCGSTHNGIASWAKYYLFNYSHLLNADVKTYMVNASAADYVDGVSTAESYWDILLNPNRLKLWLKHNYGQRLGITICLHLPLISIPIYTIPAVIGTAPQAAQDAYDKAIEAFNKKDYVEAGKQLSYAIHYGQDMTMPHHVFDYLGLDLSLNLVNLILNIVRIVDDHFDKKVHDAVESWTNSQWISNSQFRSEILNHSADFAFSIDDSRNAVYNTVESVAIWTRQQITAQEIKNIFNNGNDVLKAETTIPFLAKAMAFTIALYNKFVDDVCKAPNPPEIISQPSIGYINIPQTFKFKAEDSSNDNVSFYIDWNDGTSESTPFVQSGTVYSAIHTFSSTGNYSIRIKAKDFHIPCYSSTFSTIFVEIKAVPDPPPVPTKPSINGPSTVYTNTIATFSAVSTDPEGHFLMYTFDFGDGTKWTSDFLASGVRIYHSHTYESVGTKIVSVTVQNTRGGENGNTFIVEVNNNLCPDIPTAPDGPVEGDINKEYQFYVVGHDLEGDNIMYEVDWGDGIISTTNYCNSGTGVTLTHKWHNDAVYHVRVRVKDDKGFYSNWSNPHVIIIYDPDGPIIIP